MEKEIVIQEVVWGLGITQTFRLKVTMEEEELFRELVNRYSKVIVNEYPKVIKEYRIITLQ